LEGFTSRWTNLRSPAATSARVTCSVTSSAVAQSIGPLRRARSSMVSPSTSSHRIKVFATFAAQMKNRSDVVVAQLCGGACLGQKTSATTFICQVPRMNDFQCDFAPQICVERLVGHAHGAATELDWRAVITDDQLVLVEAIRSRSMTDIFIA